VFTECKEKPQIDYSALWLGGEPAAYLLGFVYHNTYYAYNTAFAERFSDISPGKVLLHEKIRWCFLNNDRIREVDFLRGDAYLKSKWARNSRRHVRLALFKKSPYSYLLRCIVFRIRPVIKGYLGRAEAWSGKTSSRKHAQIGT